MGGALDGGALDGGALYGGALDSGRMVAISEISEVSKQHTVSVSHFRLTQTRRRRYRTFKVSKDRLTTGWLIFNVLGTIHPLNFLCSDFKYVFQNTIGSFSLCKLELQRKYRVMSIGHNSGIVRYRPSSSGAI